MCTMSLFFSEGKGGACIHIFHLKKIFSILKFSCICQIPETPVSWNVSFSRDRIKFRMTLQTEVTKEKHFLLRTSLFLENLPSTQRRQVPVPSSHLGVCALLFHLLDNFRYQWVIGYSKVIFPLNIWLNIILIFLSINKLIKK